MRTQSIRYVENVPNAQAQHLCIYISYWFFIFLANRRNSIHMYYQICGPFLLVSQLLVTIRMLVTISSLARIFRHVLNPGLQVHNRYVLRNYLKNRRRKSARGGNPSVSSVRTREKSISVAKKIQGRGAHPVVRSSLWPNAELRITTLSWPQIPKHLSQGSLFKQSILDPYDLRCDVPP